MDNQQTPALCLDAWAQSCRHVLPWLSEFSAVVLSCFALSRFTTHSYGWSSRTTGRLAHSFVQGHGSRNLQRLGWEHAHLHPDITMTTVLISCRHSTQMDSMLPHLGQRRLRNRWTKTRSARKISIQVRGWVMSGRWAGDVCGGLCLRPRQIV